MGYALALATFFLFHAYRTQRLSLKQGRIMHQERFVRNGIQLGSNSLLCQLVT
jgi:hypothetical protein